MGILALLKRKKNEVAAEIKKTREDLQKARMEGAMPKDKKYAPKLNKDTKVNLDMSMWITHNYTKEEQEEYAPKLELAPYDAPKYEAPKYEAPKYEAPKYEAPSMRSQQQLHMRHQPIPPQHMRQSQHTRSQQQRSQNMKSLQSTRNLNQTKKNTRAHAFGNDTIPDKERETP